MTETTLRCPNCGTRIPLTDALTGQLRAELEGTLQAEHESRMAEAVARAAEQAQARQALELQDLQAQVEEQKRHAAAAEQAQLALRKQARELEAAQQQLEERVRGEVEVELRAAVEAKIKAAGEAADKRVRAESAAEVALLQKQITELAAKARQAQAHELTLRKEKAELEQRQRELDLEVARRIDAERRQIEGVLRRTIGDEQALKLKEKEKQIADLRADLEAARRRSELGSQELQGEVLELDIQAALERQFPADRIEPVPKGVRGADIIQVVCNERLEACGAIVWETKNTRHWQPAWLDKLRADQRTVGGSVAVLVSVALPNGLHGFGRIDGVWVCDLKSWLALAVALRDQLIQVAFARIASEGLNDKMELLYSYLAGDEFRQRVETIVEAFTALQAQVHKERRAMERHWAEREKQLQRVIASTAGMYGSLQGIIGTSLAAIPALEFDDGAELLEGPEGA
jgi:hypothetical protein